MIAADETRDVSGKRLRSQRTRRDDHRSVRARLGNLAQFLTDDRDEGMIGERGGDQLGETLTVHGERGTSRHPAGFRDLHHERTETTHFFLEKADGVIELVAAEGIAAHELGKAIRFVDCGWTDRPHLIERDGHMLRRRLPRGFGSCEPAANDCYRQRAPLAASRRLRDQFLRPRVIAVFIVAEYLPAELFRNLLDQIRRAAFRARLVHRPVPEDEVAVRIVRTPEEDLASLRFAFNDLAAFVRVLRTLEARRLVLDVLALGILGAGGELAEPALLDHEIRAAPGTGFVENLIRLGRPQATLFFRDSLPRRLSFRVTGAREELTEAPALDRHRLPAVLARFDLFFARFRLGLGRF